MKILTLSIISIILLTIVPVSSLIEDPQIYKTSFQDDFTKNKNHFERDFNKLMDKLYNGGNPTYDIHKILGYEEIQDIITEFSDKEMLNIIENIFSIKSKYMKHQNLNKYYNKIQDITDENNIDEFQEGLIEISSNNLCNLEDIEKLSYINKYDISKKEIEERYQEWQKYLEDRPKFNNAISQIDENGKWILFAITILIAGFLLTGLSVSFKTKFTSCIGLIEAMIISFASGFLFGSITGIGLFIWSDLTSSIGFFPLAEFLLNLSKLDAIQELPYIPNILELSSSFLNTTLNFVLNDYIQPVLTAGIASFTSVVIFSCFTILWENLAILRFIGGGILFAVMWAIAYLLIIQFDILPVYI